METDIRPDDVVEHETDDSDDSEFEDALEELVLASGIENVNISNNSINGSNNNRPAETGETTCSRSPEDREKKMAQEIVSEVITTAKQKVATADNRGHSTVPTSATTDGSRDATTGDSHSTGATSTTTDVSRDATTDKRHSIVETSATTDEGHGETTDDSRDATTGDSHSTGATSTTTDVSRDATTDKRHSIVETSATTDEGHDATTDDSHSTSTTTDTTHSSGATLYEDIHIQADAIGADTPDNIAKEPKEHYEDEAENPKNAEVSEENEEEQRDEEHLDKGDKPEYDEEGKDERFLVDEEFLKEREANLTDEEKQELKEKAQELKAEGNALFKDNNLVGAVVAYTDALRTCPLACAKERSIMWSNRAACKLHMDQKDSAIEDCTKALELNPNYMKCLLRRAELYEKTDKLDEALGDYQRALEVDPGLHIAREACMRLPEQIKERNEKLKEEMMGKLKDLGNLVLRPFGLSTDNFKLNQDPSTGGYSVSFQQNPGSS